MESMNRIFTTWFRPFWSFSGNSGTVALHLEGRVYHLTCVGLPGFEPGTS